ncbi:MAG: hypothetical protein Q9187_007714 [Circinaria calcarea]
MAARDVEDLIDNPQLDSNRSPSPGPVGLSDMRNSLTRGSSSDTSDTIVIQPRALSRVKTKNRETSSSPDPYQCHLIDLETPPRLKRPKVAEADEDNFPFPTRKVRKTYGKSVGIKKHPLDDISLPNSQYFSRQSEASGVFDEATDVSASAVLPGASQTSSSSTRRRPVFQPLALDYNLNVVIKAPRATSVPTGASSGISTVTTGTAAQIFIEGSVRRQRLARARAED